MLAERELAPYTGGDGADVALLEGPSFPLAATAVQPLAMVLHELATNSAKHGALSTPGGRVRLSWRAEESAGLMRLRWAESGGPPVAGPPRRRGFGSTVIDATARSQLGGAAAFDWAPTGLLADIDLPLSRVLAPSLPVRSPAAPAQQQQQDPAAPVVRAPFVLDGLVPRRTAAAVPGTAA